MTVLKRVSVSWPGYSKLAKLLVNSSLKFQTLISLIHQYFLLKKCEKLLQKFLFFCSAKNITVFGYRKTLNKLTC